MTVYIEIQMLLSAFLQEFYSQKQDEEKSGADVLQTSALHTEKVEKNLGVFGQWSIWKHHPISDFNLCRTHNHAN